MARRAVSRNLVALRDRHGALLVAAGGMLVAANTDGGEGRRKIEQPRRAGMLTEPCRGVFIQSGRWIFI